MDIKTTIVSGSDPAELLPRQTPLPFLPLLLLLLLPFLPLLLLLLLTSKRPCTRVPQMKEGKKTTTTKTTIVTSADGSTSTTVETSIEIAG